MLSKKGTLQTQSSTWGRGHLFDEPGSSTQREGRHCFHFDGACIVHACMGPDECEHWGMKANGRPRPARSSVRPSPSVRPSSDGMVEYGAFIPVLALASGKKECNGTTDQRATRQCSLCHSTLYIYIIFFDTLKCQQNNRDRDGPELELTTRSRLFISIYRGDLPISFALL